VKPRVRIGDRVVTRQGRGLVIGDDQRTSFVFGKPEKTAWLRVKLDVGKTTLVLPTDCSREEEEEEE
jgi:hypothetical protein